MLPKFEDVHPAFTAAGFAATNEEPELFRQILGPRRFKKIGGIASAGEIHLFTLATRCQEMILVDHSYRSLTAFYAKALLLDRLGPKATRDLFVNSTDLRNDVMPVLSGMKDAFPSPLTQKVNLNPSGGSYTTPSLADSYSLKEIRREWGLTSVKILAEAAANLYKITLIHGDLQDIKDRGPFDLLYISNMTEHRGRAGVATAASILPLVAPGGYILGTGPVLHSPGITVVKKIMGFRSQWFHTLYRKAKAPCQSS